MGGIGCHGDIGWLKPWMVYESNIGGHFHHDFMFGNAAGHAVFEGAIVKNEEKGHTQNIVPGCNHWTGLNIYPANAHFAFGVGRKLIDDGVGHLARGAAVGKTVKQHGQRRFQHGIFKVAVIDHDGGRAKKNLGLQGCSAFAAFRAGIYFLRRDAVFGPALGAAKRVDDGGFWVSVGSIGLQCLVAFAAFGLRSDFVCRNPVFGAAVGTGYQTGFSFDHDSSIGYVKQSVIKCLLNEHLALFIRGIK